MRYPLLYEINTRCWLNGLSDRDGGRVTLATVPDSEFARWQELGFTHIWLMGVWTTGARGLEEALASVEFRQFCKERWPESDTMPLGGSPFAIGEYRVSSALGGEAGLQAFRRRLRQRGLKLVLDFVPNHVGVDHPWLRKRPDLFVQSLSEVPGTFAQQTDEGVRWLAHGRDPYFAPWSDTVQMDYRRRETRMAMRETLLEVAGKCDGVRCDMAMLILNEVFGKTWVQFPLYVPGRDLQERAGGSRSGLTATAVFEPVEDPFNEAPEGEFWDEAIACVKKAHPEFLFLAEAYWGLEERLCSLGFDYTYDKELYDALVRRDAPGVQGHLLGETPRTMETRAHFLENHDEPRIASILTADEHRAAALMILSLPGMRFLHEGQLEGAQVRIPVQLLRCVVEPLQPEIVHLYEQLLMALRKSAAGRGQGVVLRPGEAWAGNSTAHHFVLIQWQADPPDFDLAVINLSPYRGQCYAPLRIPDLDRHDWFMNDLLGSEAYQRSGKDLQGQGLYLEVPGHGAQLFHFRPAD